MSGILATGWEVQVEAIAQGQPWLHREFEASLYHKTIFKKGRGIEREREILYLVIFQLLEMF